jgi:LacI family transcriptional regulator
VPTIYDVARIAGVNASTVSRALNNPGRISARTERLIRQAAESIHYQVNPMARAVKTGRTSTFALMLSDITNPVYFDLVRGAERVASAGGYTLVLAESQESAELEYAAIQRLQSSVDGMILVASRLSDEQILAFARTKRIVVINRRIDGIADEVPDATPGMTEALDHLGSFGHRSIGYVSGPTASWMNDLRWSTLLMLATERHMSIVEIAASAPTLDGGADALHRVLASGVTAVLAYNDLMAMGLMRACRAAAVSVPGRLSIVGFDDIFGADLMTPPLTTIKTPLGRTGERAMRRLISEPDSQHSHDPDALRTILIIRNSTGLVRF